MNNRIRDIKINDSSWRICVIIGGNRLFVKGIGDSMNNLWKEKTPQTVVMFKGFSSNLFIYWFIDLHI